MKSELKYNLKIKQTNMNMLIYYLYVFVCIFFLSVLIIINKIYIKTKTPINTTRFGNLIVMCFFCLFIYNIYIFQNSYNKNFEINFKI